MAAVTTRVPNFLGSGVDLIPAPLAPGFRELDLQLVQPGTINTSPYTQQQQVQRYPGAEYWLASVEMPPMARAFASAWIGFLRSLQGKTHAFQIADQSSIGPQNPDAASNSGLLVDGTTTITNAAGTSFLATLGWAADGYNVLMAGDYLQIGYRLYQLTASVSSDDSGKAVLSIAPSLREAPSNGEAIDIVAPVGIFRLAEDFKSPVSYNGLTRISFKAVEVR